VRRLRTPEKARRKKPNTIASPPRIGNQRSDPVTARLNVPVVVVPGVVVVVVTGRVPGIVVVPPGMVVPPGTVVADKGIVVAATVVLAAPAAVVVVVAATAVVVVAPASVVVVAPGTVVVVAPGTVVVVAPDAVVVVARAVVVVVAAVQVGIVMVLLSRVTAPLRASKRPVTVAPVVAVIDVNARTLPIRWEFVPSVAELPTCQKTLHAVAPLRTTTELLDAVISVDDAWKMNTAAGSPWVSRVKVPVIPRVGPP
jgi:hypothetical protein